MQPNYSVKVTTADNVTIELPLSNKFEIGPWAADDAVEVKNFRFLPLTNGDVKTMAYEFAVKFKGANKPALIVVDDDTDLPILDLFTVKAPKLDKNNYWIGSSPGYNANEERMNWINSLENGVRVLRITVTMTDGSVHVLRLPVFVPAQAKAMFRAEMGIK